MLPGHLSRAPPPGRPGSRILLGSKLSALCGAAARGRSRRLCRLAPRGTSASVPEVEGSAVQDGGFLCGGGRAGAWSTSWTPGDLRAGVAVGSARKAARSVRRLRRRLGGQEPKMAAPPRRAAGRLGSSRGPRRGGAAPPGAPRQSGSPQRRQCPPLPREGCPPAVPATPGKSGGGPAAFAGRPAAAGARGPAPALRRAQPSRRRGARECGSCGRRGRRLRLVSELTRVGMPASCPGRAPPKAEMATRAGIHDQFGNAQVCRLKTHRFFSVRLGKCNVKRNKRRTFKI